MDAELSRQLWEENPDAILAISSRGEVLHWNRAAEVIFGYSRDEALGRPLTELIIPVDQAAEEERIQQEAFSQGVAVYESVRRRKDGSLVHVSISSKPISDSTGNRLMRTARSAVASIYFRSSRFAVAQSMGSSAPAS